MTDWKEEAFRAFSAKWAEDEAEWRKKNPGKVKIYLVKATDEPPPFSSDGQVDLRSVIDALKDSKIDADATFMTLDSVDAVGGFTGEIVVLAKDLGPTLVGVLAVWLRGKAGRTVRVKDGDMEVQAPTLKEVEKGFAMLVEQRAKREQKENK